jgi:hypothetical protein
MFDVIVHVVSWSYFDAVVHFTSLVAVVVLCTTNWCRHPCTLSRFVHDVSVRKLDAVVL